MFLPFCKTVKKLYCFFLKLIFFLIINYFSLVLLILPHHVFGPTRQNAHTKTILISSSLFFFLLLFKIICTANLIFILLDFFVILTGLSQAALKLCSLRSHVLQAVIHLHSQLPSLQGKSCKNAGFSAVLSLPVTCFQRLSFLVYHTKAHT